MARSVYQIGFEADRFQALYIDSDEREARKSVVLSGENAGSTWRPASVNAHQNELQLPDLWKLVGSASFAATADTLRSLRSVLAGTELLPLRVGEDQLQVVNIVGVRDCLDRQRTRWFKDMVGGILEFPWFMPERLVGPPLFKLPHDKKVWMYCWEDDNRGPGFRKAVIEQGLTGLRFDLVWDSEGGARRLPSLPIPPESV